MATEKFPHEIAIDEVVGGDINKLPVDIRQKINGFNVSKTNSKNPDNLKKASYEIADLVYNWDETDLPEEEQQQDDAGKSDEGAAGSDSSQQQSNGDAGANGDKGTESTADSNTADSNKPKEDQTNPEDKKDDQTPGTETKHDETEEPEFIEDEQVAPFGRVKKVKVPNPKYKPKQ